MLFKDLSSYSIVKSISIEIEAGMTNKRRYFIYHLYYLYFVILMFRFIIGYFCMYNEIECFFKYDVFISMVKDIVQSNAETTLGIVLLILIVIQPHYLIYYRPDSLLCSYAKQVMVINADQFNKHNDNLNFNHLKLDKKFHIQFWNILKVRINGNGVKMPFKGRHFT